VTRRTDAFPDLYHNGCTGIDQKHKHGDKEMTNQMTLDKTAELSNQELSLEQLEDVHGGLVPQLLGGAAVVYGAWKLGKWLVKKVGGATANLDSDSGCGGGQDSCGDANKLSYYEMRKEFTPIV